MLAVLASVVVAQRYGASSMTALSRLSTWTDFGGAIGPMLVGLLRKEPGVPPAQSARYGLRIVEPGLDAMSVPHELLEESADAGKIVPAIDKAYRESAPVVLLVGTSPK